MSFEIEKNGGIGAPISRLELSACQITPTEILDARIDTNIGDARGLGDHDVRAARLNVFGQDPDPRDRKRQEMIGAVRGMAGQVRTRHAAQTVHRYIGLALA